MVLGHSRLLCLRFFPRQTMEVLFRGLEGAFKRFGGVPEELLFDQMKAVALSDGRGSGRELVLKPDFQRFARHRGVLRVPADCVGRGLRARWSA